MAFEDYTLVAMELALKGTLQSTIPGDGIIASTAQALAGTDDTSIMTPLKVQQALAPIIFNFAPLNQAVPLSSAPVGYFLGKGSTADDDFQWRQITITGTVATIGVTSANGFAGTSNGDGVNPRLTLSTTVSGILQGNGTAISAASTTGSGDVVRANTPTLVNPVLGTPASVNLTNATNVPVNQAIGNLGVSHLNSGTGASATTFWRGDGTWASVGSVAGTVQTVSVATANGLAGASDGDPTNPTLTLSTSVTGLLKGNGTAISAATAGTDYLSPAAIGVTVQAWDADLDSWAAVVRASGFDTFTATPSSANFRALLTDETGTGAAVFATSPTLVTPNLGTPSAVDLTNATNVPRSTPRMVSTASTATLTPNAGTTDIAAVTAQAASLTIAAPTGSPVDGQQLTIRIRDNGTARALTWNAAYVPYQSGQLPTTTIINKTHYLVFWWNSATSVWELVTGNPIAGLWG